MIFLAFMLAASLECDDRAGDIAAAECWSTAAEAADAELSKVWRDVLTVTREADKDFQSTPRKQRGSAAADSVSSQRAWLKFRSAQCSFEGDWAQGGSLENVLVAKCQTTMTKQRITQLREIIGDFQEH